MIALRHATLAAAHLGDSTATTVQYAALPDPLATYFLSNHGRERGLVLALDADAGSRESCSNYGRRPFFRDLQQTNFTPQELCTLSTASINGANSFLNIDAEDCECLATDRIVTNRCVSTCFWCNANSCGSPIFVDSFDYVFAPYSDGRPPTYKLADCLAFTSGPYSGSELCSTLYFQNLQLTFQVNGEECELAYTCDQQPGFESPPFGRGLLDYIITCDDTAVNLCETSVQDLGDSAIKAYLELGSISECGTAMPVAAPVVITDSPAATPVATPSPGLTSTGEDRSMHLIVLVAMGWMFFLG